MKRNAKKVTYEVSEKGCHICTSHNSNNNKYPSIMIDGRSWVLSRYIYTKLNGPIGQGLVIRHICDNKKCINPNHLIIGTVRENIIDSVERGIHPMGERSSLSKLNEKQVIEIFTSNLPVCQLGKIYGVTHSTINNIKLGISWKHITSKITGIPSKKGHLRKLTKDQVIEIFYSKDSYNKLSKKYGVVAANICKIKRKEYWRDIVGSL